MPMALIASALAAASSQAIRSVAKEKRISSLKNVNVTVEKILTANDDAQLHRKIELIGELSGEERTILLAAAKKNEVEALLSKDIVIDTSSV